MILNFIKNCVSHSTDAVRLLRQVVCLRKDLVSTGSVSSLKQQRCRHKMETARFGNYRLYREIYARRLITDSHESRKYESCSLHFYWTFLILVHVRKRCLQAQSFLATSRPSECPLLDGRVNGKRISHGQRTAERPRRCGTGARQPFPASTAHDPGNVIIPLVQLLVLIVSDS